MNFVIQKNESRVVFGDGLYNSFRAKKEKAKDYHDQLI